MPEMSYVDVYSKQPLTTTTLCSVMFKVPGGPVRIENLLYEFALLWTITWQSE